MWIKGIYSNSYCFTKKMNEKVERQFIDIYTVESLSI